MKYSRLLKLLILFKIIILQGKITFAEYLTDPMDLGLLSKVGATLRKATGRSAHTGPELELPSYPGVQLGGLAPRVGGYPEQSPAIRPRRTSLGHRRKRMRARRSRCLWAYNARMVTKAPSLVGRCAVPPSVRHIKAKKRKIE